MKEYTIYIHGVKAVKIADAIIGSECFTHIMSEGNSIAQMEITMNDLVDVAYVDGEDNVRKVIALLSDMGFGGCEYTLCETIEEGCIARDTVIEQGTITSTKETKSEEETTMKNTKGYSFEIRQLDAWGNNEEGYEINESWHMGEMVTKAQDIRKAFTAWMKRHLGISFKLNRTLIEYDGDCYTIIDRKTKEPLFIAIPQY